MLAGAALLSLVGAQGCGDGSASPTVVRVGGVAIERATVDHWADAIQLGNTVGTSLGQSSGTAREKALDFLISSHWLIGEVTEQGLAVSDSTVKRRIDERIESEVGGRPAFEEELSSTHQTIADVKLEIKAELAASMLRERVSSRVPAVTQAEIADYYERHSHRFRIPELRIADLVEAIPSRAAAIALGKRIGPGKRFARKALHEQVARQAPYEAAHSGNGELVRTIFTAIPGEVAGPVRFAGGWVLVVVRRTVPGRAQPLATVRGEIDKRLTNERRRLTAIAFAKGYRSKWTARTNCRAGFVVQKCSQHRGPAKPEANPLSSP